MGDNELKRKVISVIVDNESNVLSRVIGLFSRRGFNIDSLTVSATNDPKLARITIVFTGTENANRQIITQTEKLEVVREIFPLEEETSLYRELLLIKLRADKTERTAIREIVDIFRGKIVSLAKDSLIIEMTGDPGKIDAFMNMMSCYDIAEVCRTGATGIGRDLRE